MGILQKIEADLSIIWRLFTDCVYAVFTAEENAIMADCLELFKAEGVAIQNASPGLSTKEFIALLVATAVPKLTADLAGLGVAAYTAIAATIAHDLGTLDGGGNAGTLTSGVDTTPAS